MHNFTNFELACVVGIWFCFGFATRYFLDGLIDFIRNKNDTHNNEG